MALCSLAGVAWSQDTPVTPYARLRTAYAAADPDAAAAAAARPDLADWRFPDVIDRDDRTSWFMVLDPDYDPLPTWRRYPGEALFLFGVQDDSTPTERVVERLRSLEPNGRRQIVVDPRSQHLGLGAESRCSGLAGLDRFSPAVVDAIDQWAERVAGSD